MMVEIIALVAGLPLEIQLAVFVAATTAIGFGVRHYLLSRQRSKDTAVRIGAFVSDGLRDCHMATGMFIIVGDPYIEQAEAYKASMAEAIENDNEEVRENLEFATRNYQMAVNAGAMVEAAHARVKHIVEQLINIEPGKGRHADLLNAQRLAGEAKTVVEMAQGLEKGLEKYAGDPFPHENMD